ncbi:capsid protein [robinz virus RP_326]|nr:capsid protein [robinz virus RP_326]
MRRYTKRRFPRRKALRRPFSRKRGKIPRRRPMTKRAVLNVTTKKKRDDMIPTRFYTTGQGAPVIGGVVIPSTGISSIVFVPTARSIRPADANGIASYAQRSSHDTFSVGYKERVSLEMLPGAVFQWRRIVFSMSFATVPGLFGYLETEPIGMSRVVDILLPTDAAKISGVLFRGNGGIDWNFPITAPVDTTRVKLFSDKLRILSPGADIGAVRNFKEYYSTRQRFTYNDDETGKNISNNESSYYAVQNRQSMQDLVVFDIFAPSAGSSETAGMVFSPEGSYYWHEK